MITWTRAATRTRKKTQATTTKVNRKNSLILVLYQKIHRTKYKTRKSRKISVPVFFGSLKTKYVSWEEFPTAFEIFQRESYQQFAKRSSTSVKIRNNQMAKNAEALKTAGKRARKTMNLIPTSWGHYPKTLKCVHGQKYKPRGRGKSKHRNAKLNARVTATSSGGWELKVSASGMHNHRIGKALWESYAENRTVKDPVLTKNVEILHRAGANVKGILRYLRERSGSRKTTLKDVHNMVQGIRVKPSGNQTDAERAYVVLDEFCGQNGGNDAEVIVASDTDVAWVVTFQTSKMKRLFSDFPEVVMVDSTHNTSINRYKLFSFVVHDVFGKGQYVHHALVESEHKADLRKVVEIFKINNADWHKIRVIMADKAVHEKNVLCEMFPQATQLFCQWHVVTWLKKQAARLAKPVSKQVKALMSLLVYAKSEQEYEDAKDAMLEKNWRINGCHTEADDHQGDVQADNQVNQVDLYGGKDAEAEKKSTERAEKDDEIHETKNAPKTQKPQSDSKKKSGVVTWKFADCPLVNGMTKAQRKRAKAKENYLLARALAAKYREGKIGKMAIDKWSIYLTAPTVCSTRNIWWMRYAWQVVSEIVYGRSRHPCREEHSTYEQDHGTIETIKIDDIDLLAYWPDGYTTFDQLDARNLFILVMRTMRWIDDVEWRVSTYASRFQIHATSLRCGCSLLAHRTTPKLTNFVDMLTERTKGCDPTRCGRVVAGHHFWTFVKLVLLPLNPSVPDGSRDEYPNVGIVSPSFYDFVKTEQRKRTAGGFGSPIRRTSASLGFQRGAPLGCVPIRTKLRDDREERGSTMRTSATGGHADLQKGRMLHTKRYSSCGVWSIAILEILLSEHRGMTASTGCCRTYACAFCTKR
ncbi:MULE transposase domain [Phytophthora cactorum]|nr:MULE transposase domain [Phytophthora cactorum]